MDIDLRDKSIEPISVVLIWGNQALCMGTTKVGLMHRGRILTDLLDELLSYCFSVLHQV